MSRQIGVTDWSFRHHKIENKILSHCRCRLTAKCRRYNAYCSQGMIVFSVRRRVDVKSELAAMFQHSVHWRSALNVVIGLICLLLVTTTTIIGPPGAEAAVWTSGQRHPQRGCVDARLCCAGKNSTCRVHGPRANDPRSRICYCDTACFSTNDCCEDLQLACNIST